MYYIDLEFVKRLFDLCNRLRPLKFHDAMKKISSQVECILLLCIRYIYIYYIVRRLVVYTTRVICIRVYNATSRPPPTVAKSRICLTSHRKRSSLCCGISISGNSRPRHRSLATNSRFLPYSYIQPYNRIIARDPKIVSSSYIITFKIRVPRVHDAEPFS